MIRSVLVFIPVAIGGAAVEWRSPFEVVNSGPVAEDTGRSRGAAWGDFDGNGYPDLFVTRATYDASAPPQPNVLYRNDGGRFVRVEGGPTGTQDGESEGAVWVDLDNDGDLDLHVVGRSGAGSTFHENTGDGRLVRVGADPLGGAVTSASMACWADADGDGRLDVFVVGYRTDRNALFRNTGGWGFERVSLPTQAEGDGSGRACAWGDLDGDGLPELVIATARRANVLLRNRGGMTFTVDAGSPLEHDIAYGYGLSWTDVNSDGLRDLFVANFDAGNSLYLGREDGGLEPVALGDALQSAASKGHAWGDFDMDGREDLYLGSGTPGPAMYNRLWLATGSGGFALADDAAMAAHADTSAAIAAADFDGDGALDLFVANWGSLQSPNRLYRNTAASRAWLKVGLEGVRSNRMGIGARVSVLVTIDGERRWRHRWLDASTGYAGQNEPIIHFGLAAAEAVDSLVVRWPSGTVDRHGRTSVRRLVRVREGTSPGATS